MERVEQCSLRRFLILMLLHIRCRSRGRIPEGTKRSPSSIPTFELPHPISGLFFLKGAVEGREMRNCRPGNFGKGKQNVHRQHPTEGETSPFVFLGWFKFSTLKDQLNAHFIATTICIQAYTYLHQNQAINRLPYTYIWWQCGNQQFPPTSSPRLLL